MNIAPYKYGCQLLGTQLRAGVSSAVPWSSQTQGSDLCRAIAKGQDLFQMLGTTHGEKGSPERGDEGCGDNFWYHGTLGLLS